MRCSTPMLPRPPSPSCLQSSHHGAPVGAVVRRMLGVGAPAAPGDARLAVGALHEHAPRILIIRMAARRAGHQARELCGAEALRAREVREARAARLSAGAALSCMPAVTATLQLRHTRTVQLWQTTMARPRETTPARDDMTTMPPASHARPSHFHSTRPSRLPTMALSRRTPTHPDEEPRMSDLTDSSMEFSRSPTSSLWAISSRAA